VYSFLRQATCDADGQPAPSGKQLLDQVIKEVDDVILAAGDQMGGAVAKSANK
jgi:hypothetical protein